MRAPATRATAQYRAGLPRSGALRRRWRGRSPPSGSPRCLRRASPTRVVRYDLPKLGAFNFVLDDVLEGGVNSSLGLDGHGKSLSFLLLPI